MIGRGLRWHAGHAPRPIPPAPFEGGVVISTSAPPKNSPGSFCAGKNSGEIWVGGVLLVPVSGSQWRDLVEA